MKPSPLVNDNFGATVSISSTGYLVVGCDTKNVRKVRMHSDRYLETTWVFCFCDHSLPPGADMLDLWLSVLCMRSKAWLAAHACHSG
jgi:hypothetical protein